VAADEDLPKIITLTASEVDGDNLTLIVVDQPENGDLSNITWPTLTYTPSPEYSGADSFTFKVNDGTSDSNVATVNLLINPVNDAPLVTNPGDQDNTEGDSVLLPIDASDKEKNTLSFSIVGQPKGLQIDSINGMISGKLDFESSKDSPYTVTVTVNDGQIDSEIVFTWTVHEAPRLFLPVITVSR
jgi:hypothetical protein